MKRNILILLALSFSMTGCGSFSSRFSAGYHDEYYSGVKYSIEQTNYGNGFYYIDIPFSFIFDTVMLPADVIRIESSR